MHGNIAWLKWLVHCSPDTQHLFLFFLFQPLTFSLLGGETEKQWFKLDSITLEAQMCCFNCMHIFFNLSIVWYKRSLSFITDYLPPRRPGHQSISCSGVASRNYISEENLSRKEHVCGYNSNPPVTPITYVQYCWKSPVMSPRLMLRLRVMRSVQMWNTANRTALKGV